MFPIDESGAEENVGWPGYVDFLSTFVFVLIIFIGSLLYLLSGGIGRHITDGFIAPVQRGLVGAGVTVVREGDKLVIPMSREGIQYKTNEWELNSRRRQFLREIGHYFSAKGIRRIVVDGRADSQGCESDPFCNWEYSVKRSREVLKFLYTCTDCGYGEASGNVRRLLVLSGEGDVGASSSHKGDARDRRVDIVLDFNVKQE